MEGLNNLMELLPKGEANAISMAELSRVTGLEDRALRKVIFSNRINGEIIASGIRGYFIPTTKKELMQYYRRHLSRGKATLATLKATRRKLRELGVAPEELR